MAVLVGSRAVKQLFEENEKAAWGNNDNSADSKNYEDTYNTENLEDLFEGQIDYTGMINAAELLDIFFNKKKVKQAEKNKQLLCAPVSAVTAEPAADAQADAQTASDNSAEDAAAEADSVPEDQLLSSREQFSVAAKAALLIDLNTNRVVYEQDADERVYPASLTKIMTCLIALENGNLSDVVTVSESALADLDEDSSVAGLVVGEQMTLENLLYCMMVVSGNDACNVIAEHVAGSVTDFVRMMNQRAYELGCTNTHFNNPHGLHDESHYTTARDLAIITQAALKSENFRQIVDTYEYKLPDDNMGRV